MVTNCFDRYLPIALFIFLPLLGGCASHSILRVDYDADEKNYKTSCISPKVNGDEIADALKHHVIDIDKQGRFSPIKFSIDCRGKLQTGEQEKSIDQLVAKISSDLKDGGFQKLLIYIHGGLVTREAGIESSIELTRAVLNDPDLEGKTYPISIVWRSGGWESYGDQLFSVREGVVNRPLAIFTWPFKFGSDLGRGIVDTPYAGGVEAYRLFNTLGNKLNRCDSGADGGATVICPDPEDFSSFSALKTAGYVLLTPLRIVTSPIVNGLGRPGYENMIRHTRSAFLRDTTEPPQAGAADGYRGAVYWFFDKLQARLDDEKTAMPIKLTLIGHSMGTMLISEVIREFPRLPYERVVFMGAAVSIRDFQNTALPRLADTTKDKIEFYNLSLLPLVDARELTDYNIGAIPSGSLLEYIDEMYTSPPTLADRTLGKWVNISSVLPTFPEEVKKNMTMRVFGREDGTSQKDGQPQAHGEFNDIDKCFWRKTYWTATDSEWAQHYTQCASYLTQLFGDRASR